MDGFIELTFSSLVYQWLILVKIQREKLILVIDIWLIDWLVNRLIDWLIELIGVTFASHTIGVNHH